MTYTTRLFAAVLLAAWLSAGGRAAEPKPNLVLILADDMAWDDCGAYGHKTIRTPHLDRLAREGLRFDRSAASAPPLDNIVQR